MGANKLLIAEKDMEYGRALARAISGLHSEFELTIISITKIHNELQNDKFDFEYYDLFLIGGLTDVSAKEICKSFPDSRKIVILSDCTVESLRRQSDNPEKHFWYIYKFCSVNDIISDLYFLIAYVTGKKRFLRKSLATELIGFYSVCGGAGNTVCSLGTARELSRYRDKKVLYLSFEEMPATELFVKNNRRDRNIGDFLYYLLEKQNFDLCSHPETFAASDDFGVEVFLTSGGPNDLNDLTQDELLCFLRVISDSSRYDYIILDCNGRLSEENLFLLNLCSVIILVQNNHPASRFKHKKLLDYLSKLSNFKNKHRFLIVTNQADGTEIIDREILDENGYKTIRIEKDGNSFHSDSNQLHIDISHAFGIGMKKIADEIMSAESGRGRAKCMENSVL